MWPCNPPRRACTPQAASPRRPFTFLSAQLAREQILVGLAAHNLAHLPVFYQHHARAHLLVVVVGISLQ